MLLLNQFVETWTSVTVAWTLNKNEQKKISAQINFNHLNALSFNQFLFNFLIDIIFL